MSTIVTTTVTCDRCKHDLVIDDTVDREGWGVLSGRQNGGRAIGSVDGPDDLCPTCFASLLAWLTAPPGPIKPMPPQAVTQRVPWTLIDRRAAITAVEEQLRQRVECALSVVREQPTVILSGEVVPGAHYGSFDAAALIVDLVVRQLGALPFSSGDAPECAALTDFDNAASVNAAPSAPQGRPSNPALAAAKPEHVSP